MQHKDCKEIQPVHSEGDQPWDFFGRTDAKAETPVLWHLMRRVDSLEKTDAGRDWGQEKGTTEDEMAGWHHQLDEHEFEWTRGVGDRQGGLVCWDSWGRKESDTTERLNWTASLYLRLWDSLKFFSSHTPSLLKELKSFFWVGHKSTRSYNSLKMRLPWWLRGEESAC